MKGRCVDCKKFSFKRKREWQGREYYYCNAIVEAQIPEETIYDEAECRFFKHLDAKKNKGGKNGTIN